MLGLHLKVFQGFVELLVLRPLLLLLECLDLHLLFQKTALHLRHVDICLQHLRQEVVGSGNRYARLHKELHSLHDIGSSRVVTNMQIVGEKDDKGGTYKAISRLMSFWTSSESANVTGSSPSKSSKGEVSGRVESVLTDRHVLSEGHLALPLDELL